MQKEKNRAGVGRERVPRPLSQIPRVLFSHGLFYFHGRPYSLRAWHRLPTLHLFRNASREEYFCKRYFPYSSGQTKTDFLENDDVLVSDLAPDNLMSCDSFAAGLKSTSKTAKVLSKNIYYVQQCFVR